MVTLEESRSRKSTQINPDVAPSATTRQALQSEAARSYSPTYKSRIIGTTRRGETYNIEEDLQHQQIAAELAAAPRRTGVFAHNPMELRKMQRSTGYQVTLSPDEQRKLQRETFLKYSPVYQSQQKQRTAEIQRMQQQVYQAMRARQQIASSQETERQRQARITKWTKRMEAMKWGTFNPAITKKQRADLRRSVEYADEVYQREMRKFEAGTQRAYEKGFSAAKDDEGLKPSTKFYDFMQSQSRKTKMSGWQTAEKIKAADKKYIQEFGNKIIATYDLATMFISLPNLPPGISYAADKVKKYVPPVINIASTSVGNLAEFIGMIPGGAKVTAVDISRGIVPGGKKSQILAPAIRVGARESTVGLGEAFSSDPVQTSADILTAFAVTAGAAKVARIPKQFGKKAKLQRELKTEYTGQLKSEITALERDIQFYNKLANKIRADGGKINDGQLKQYNFELKKLKMDLKKTGKKNYEVIRDRSAIEYDIKAEIKNLDTLKMTGGDKSSIKKANARINRLQFELKQLPRPTVQKMPKDVKVSIQAKITKIRAARKAAKQKLSKSFIKETRWEIKELTTEMNRLIQSSADPAGIARIRSRIKQLNADLSILKKPGKRLKPTNEIDITTKIRTGKRNQLNKLNSEIKTIENKLVNFYKDTLKSATENEMWIVKNTEMYLASLRQAKHKLTSATPKKKTVQPVGKTRKIKTAGTKGLRKQKTQLQEYKLYLEKQLKDLKSSPNIDTSLIRRDIVKVNKDISRLDLRAARQGKKLITAYDMGKIPKKAGPTAYPFYFKGQDILFVNNAIMESIGRTSIKPELQFKPAKPRTLKGRPEPTFEMSLKRVKSLRDYELSFKHDAAKKALLIYKSVEVPEHITEHHPIQTHPNASSQIDSLIRREVGVLVNGVVSIQTSIHHIINVPYIPPHPDIRKIKERERRILPTRIIRKPPVLPITYKLKPVKKVQRKRKSLYLTEWREKNPVPTLNQILGIHKAPSRRGTKKPSSQSPKSKRK